MFFIGVFGIERKEKAIKSWNIVCPHCARMTKAAFYMRYTYFHIFFIPTFRWSRRYFVKMRCCGAVYDAPEEYAQELKEADSIDFTRLKKVSTGFGGFSDFYAICRSCGRNFERSYPFCPYCGNKQ